jgi:hypothetical protein
VFEPWSNTPPLTAPDEQVHIWYYDWQGGIQSYGLNILKNLPHFFILLLAFQRLDLEGWGFAPNLSFETDSHSPAELDITLYKPTGGLGALVLNPAAGFKFTRNRVFRAHWGLVGRVATVYGCDLTGRPPKEQMVKLSWPEVSRTPEPEILKGLGETPNEGVEVYIPDLLPDLLASHMPTMIDTQLIRKRLGTPPQAHFPESPVPRRLVTIVCRKLFPAWDLPPDGYFDIWMQTISCTLKSATWGFHN